MLIITFVISFAVVSAVSTDRTNESTMFQRMTTLLIYQLENTPSDMENTIRSYEEKYHLYAVIENTEGQEIYQSDFAFPAQTDILLEDISEQNSQQQIVPEGEVDGTVTSQGGIYEITVQSRTVITQSLRQLPRRDSMNIRLFSFIRFQI